MPHPLGYPVKRGALTGQLLEDLLLGGAFTQYFTR
jgi:hypothetical protein